MLVLIVLFLLQLFLEFLFIGNDCSASCFKNSNVARGRGIEGLLFT